MGTCSTACTRRELWSLAIRLKDLCCLLFRVFPKLLDVRHNLLKKICKGEHVHPPAVALETLVGTLPELPQDILEAIFATLEIDP